MPDRKFTPISCMKNFIYEKFHTRFRPEIFHTSLHVKIMVADLCHFVFSLFRGDITKAP